MKPIKNRFAASFLLTAAMLILTSPEGGNALFLRPYLLISSVGRRCVLNRRSVPYRKP